MARKWWLIGGGVAAAMIAVAIAAPYLRKDPFRALEQELKSEGMPTTYGQLLALGRPNGADASPIYEKFISDASNIKDPQQRTAFKELSEHVTKLSPKDRDSRALKLREFLQPLMEGSKKDRWSIWKGDGSRSKMNSMPVALNILGYLAVADARKGNFDLAFEEMRALARISAQIGANFDITLKVNQLRRNRTMLMRLHDIMLVGRNNPDILVRGIEFIHSLPPPPDLRTALKADCGEIFGMFRTSKTMTVWRRNEEDTPDSFDVIQDKVWYGPKVRRWGVLEVKMQLEAYRSLPPGPVDWEEAASAYETVAKKNAKHPDMFSRSFVGYLPRFCEAWGRYEAHRRVELAALRIQLYRLENGFLPHSMPSFSDVGDDPFAHKPLRYRLEGNGFVVYSVDRDRIDSGGIRSIDGLRNFDIVADF